MKAKIILNDIKNTVMWVDENFIMPQTLTPVKKWFRKPRLFIDNDKTPIIYKEMWRLKKDIEMMCYLRAVLVRKLNVDIRYPVGRDVIKHRRANIVDLLRCDSYRSLPNKSTLSVEVFNEKDKSRVIVLTGKNKTIVERRKKIKTLLKKKRIEITDVQDVRELWLSLVGLIDLNYKKHVYGKDY